MEGNKIKVVDSIMGSGKTTWAINTIKNNRCENFVYITPYLEEIQRLKEATKTTNKMYEPNYHNSNKQDHFHKLLREGKNICSTHALFRKANDITRNALLANEYILILDEVMDVVEELKNFTKNDFNTLINEELIHIENDYIIWNKDKMDYDGRYNDIKNMAINKNLICINSRILFWNFPVDIFKYFKEVYILTYMFDAQIQKYYYDFHNIEYEYYQIDDNYNLVDYNKNRDKEKIKQLKKLINIYDGKYNLIGEEDYSLSLNWFKNDDGTLQGILKNNLYNWFNNVNRDIKSKYRLWTTFKDYRSKLSNKGYTKSFISLNTRATNNYKEKYILAYCCNRYIKPTITLFFNKRSIKLNQDKYALSEMLQWIWRSRIRDGKTINIYIPSKRMRNLLKTYLQ